MSNDDLFSKLKEIGISKKIYFGLKPEEREFIKNCIFYNIKDDTKVAFKYGDILVLKNLKNNQFLKNKTHGYTEKFVYIQTVFGLILGAKLLDFTKKNIPKLGKVYVLNPLYNSTYPEVDPDYIDSILLGQGGYNPLYVKQKIKNAKKKAVYYNKCISAKISNFDEFIFYLENNPSDNNEYFISRTLYGLSKDCWKIKVVSVCNQVPLSDEEAFIKLLIARPSETEELLEPLYAPFHKLCDPHFYISKLKPYAIDNTD